MASRSASPKDQAKLAAARKACDLVRDGMTVGLGTGSTAALFVEELGARLAAKRLKGVRGVPTSRATEALAVTVGVPLLRIEEAGDVDLTVDGADEVDPDLQLIKGLGGALLREKIVAQMSRDVTIVVDEGKLVRKLGRGVVPAEILPLAVRSVSARVEKLGGKPRLRERAGKPVVSDNGNHFLDCEFGGIDDPARLERDLNLIPGVVENGLFVGVATRVIVGGAGGAVRVLTRPRS